MMLEEILFCFDLIGLDYNIGLMKDFLNKAKEFL